MHGNMGRKQLEIEKLLQWAYREELSKRTTSSAEGIWDRIRDFGQRGGIDPGHGAAQRYPHFGLPHPDAEAIEAAVGMLDNAEIDWRAEAADILGDLRALAEPAPRDDRPTDGWYSTDKGPQRVQLGRPRVVMLVRTLSPSALITMHAKMGTRPDWRSDYPQAGPTPAAKGPNAKVIGECRGKNLYSAGSYCPVSWSPSPITVAEARADYLAWWRGMQQLVDTLMLGDFEPLPSLAPEMPWRDEEAVPSVIDAAIIRSFDGVLPLKPKRKAPERPPQRARDPGRVLTLGSNR